MARLVSVLSQPLHSCIESSLWVNFFLEIFLWRLVSVLFDNNLLTLIVTQYHPCNCGWCVIRARVHWQMASNSQYALPSVFPTKIAGVRLQLCSKQSPKGASSENFLAIGGFFECNTYRNTLALGCLKKKEDKQFFFQLFQISHLRTSFRCLWTLAFATRRNYHRVNAIIHWLEPPSCFPHSYIYMRYDKGYAILWAHNILSCCCKY